LRAFHSSHLGPGSQGPDRNFLGVVHLDQRDHAQRLDDVQQRLQGVLLPARHHQQHHVAPCARALVHLVRADDKILHSNGTLTARPHPLGQGRQRPPKCRCSRQHADSRAPRPWYSLPAGRIEHRGQLAARRAARFTSAMTPMPALFSAPITPVAAAAASERS